MAAELRSLVQVRCFMTFGPIPSQICCQTIEIVEFPGLFMTSKLNINWRKFGKADAPVKSKVEPPPAAKTYAALAAVMRTPPLLNKKSAPLLHKVGTPVDGKQPVAVSTLNQVRRPLSHSSHEVPEQS